MNTKEEVISFLKEHKFLGDINLNKNEGSNLKDYNNTIEQFNKWCEYCNYPQNYTSFYYFMCEFGEPIIKYNNSFSVLYIKCCNEYIDLYETTGTFYNNLTYLSRKLEYK